MYLHRPCIGSYRQRLHTRAIDGLFCKQLKSRLFIQRRVPVGQSLAPSDWDDSWSLSRLATPSFTQMLYQKHGSMLQAKHRAFLRLNEVRHSHECYAVRQFAEISRIQTHIELQTRYRLLKPTSAKRQLLGVGTMKTINLHIKNSKLCLA